MSQKRKNPDTKNDNTKDNESKNDNKRNKYNNEDIPPIRPPPILRLMFGIPPYELRNKFNMDSNPDDENPEDKEPKKKKDNDDDYFKVNGKLVELLPLWREVKTIKDLIEIGECYDPKDEKRYVINLKILNRCVPALKELNNMIGMKSIKERVIDLFFFHLQSFFKDDQEGQMMHTIIEGTPGSGKTEVAKILAKIYYGLGIVENKKFTIAKRSDLIGKYLGHTAKNTQKVFDKAKGGVIFIDEAYSLGNPEGRDSFSKECIDTINQNLTEMKSKTIVIVAGYKKELAQSFFSYNPGLLRRFPYRFTIGKYTFTDICQIYEKKVENNKWVLNKSEDKKRLDFFEKNIKFFPYNGGDMEILWDFTKITHARRVFGKDPKLRKIINMEDINNGFKLMLTNDEIKNRNNKLSDSLLASIYC